MADFANTVNEKSAHYHLSRQQQSVHRIPGKIVVVEPD